MANWDILKRAISDVIMTNGNREITGQLLQQALLNIIMNVGANATFSGIATPTTNPGTPDGPLFYIAYEKGIYANFNAINITEEDGLVIILYSNNWNKINIPLASKDELALKVDKVTDIEQVRSQATNKVPSSKLLDDLFNSANNDIVFNTLTTKRVKLNGDWRTGEVLYLNVKNLAVSMTGLFNVQAWDWTNSKQLAVTSVNGVTKIILTQNTAIIGIHLNLTGTVTSAYCIASLHDSLDAINRNDISINAAAISLLDDELNEKFDKTSLESARSQSTTKAPTSKLLDDLFNSANNDIVFNTLTTKRVKLNGDWRTGEVLYLNVKNLAVETTGLFAVQAWDWTNSKQLAVTSANGVTKIILTQNTAIIGIHLNLTGKVTSAYCIASLHDSLDAINRNDISINAAAISANATELSLAKLQNGISITQTETQKIIKVGTLSAGSFLRLEIANANIQTTGAYNFQIYDATNRSVLAVLSNTRFVEVILPTNAEIWFVSNVTGVITRASFDVKMTSSVKAIEDRNLNSVIRFKDLQTYGFDHNTTGYVAYPSLALFSYQNMNASTEGVLKNILINVAVAGTFTFAVGSLDQRNWAIISKEFDISIPTTGRKNIDVSDKFITIGENDYLFVYTKKNGSETINYKNYTGANSNPNFIFGDPAGAIEPNQSTYGGGIVFSWDVISFYSYFASKNELEKANESIQNISSVANTAYNSISTITDQNGNKYKMWVVGGNITLQPLNYQRVMVIGNSLLTGLAGRGLASTVAGNDFAAHLLTGIQEKYPAGVLTRISAANWERNISTDTATFDALFADASGVYDLIVIRIGENVNNVSLLQEGVEAMVDYLKNIHPLATIVITSTILDYNAAGKNTALSSAATNKNAYYVAINGSTNDLRIGTSRMYTNGSNAIVPSDYTILTHSNDLGFLVIANSILSAIGYDQLNKSHAINVATTVTADYPVLGVENGIVSIKTYGASQPTIIVNSGAIPVTHYQLSTFTYDNRLITGVADTATFVSTFIMPSSDVDLIIN